MILMYAIILVVVIALYAVAVTLRYIAIHAKYHKQKVHASLHELFNEIKYMVHKEDNMESKEQYKVSRHSESLSIGDINETFYLDSITMSDGLSNSYLRVNDSPSLTQLLTAKPTDEDYERILEHLIELFKLTYNDYKFYLAKSSDETKAPNFLQVTSPSTEHTSLHKSIFKLAVDKGIDMKELQKRFAEKASNGHVVDLGDNAVVITDDGTPQLPTGVSPVQSGLEGSEITFIISFIKSSNFGEWYKNTFPEEEKDGE